MKGVGRRFSSAASRCGREAHGGAWLGRPKVGEDPRVRRLGPESTASSANAKKSQGK
jgi:hypothetical protein